MPQKSEPRLIKGKRIYAVWYENSQRKYSYFPKNYDGTPEAWFESQFAINRKSPFYQIIYKVFQQEYIDKNAPTGTISCYMAAIRAAEKYKPEGDWKKSDVTPFATELCKTHATNSVSIILSALSGVCKKACLFDWLEFNPFAFKPKLTPSEPTRFKPFTTLEADRLIEHLEKTEPEAALLCLLVRHTLIRPGELAKLTISNIEIEKRLIFVPATVSKNKQSGYAVIPSFLISELQKRVDIDKNKLLFKNIERLQKIITLSIQELCLPPQCSLYSFKHTGAIELLNATNDVYLVKQQARHKSVASTEKYLKLIEIDRLLKAIS